MTPLHPDIAQFRLGVHVQEAGGAASLSRALGPFNLMSREEPRFTIVQPIPENGAINLDWQWVTACDALFLANPFRPEDVRRAHLAEVTRTPLWVDYFDDLTSIRPSHPRWLDFVAVDIRTNLAEIAKLATVVTCTTETLRQRLPHPERVRVIPESCRWEMFPPRVRQRNITWRGFGSHHEDLEAILPQLQELSHLPPFQPWDWVFFGEPYWKVFDGVIPKDRMVYVPPLPPYDLMHRWAGMAPYVHLAPLARNAFTEAKSPLSWLEATSLGAAVIGPDLTEWRDCPGLMTYRTPEEFGKVLRHTLETWDQGKPHPNVAVSRAAIYPRRTLTAANTLRWAVLNELAQSRQNQKSATHA